MSTTATTDPSLPTIVLEASTVAEALRYTLARELDRLRREGVRLSEPLATAIGVELTHLVCSFYEQHLGCDRHDVAESVIAGASVARRAELGAVTL